MKTVQRMAALWVTLSILFSMCSASIMPVAGTTGDFIVTNLTTEGEIYPVTDATPHFSWNMSSNAAGKRQTAYQVIVRNGSETIWDSGKSEGDASVAIPYGGPALSPSTVYSWTVTVWDEDGNLAVSEPAGFETGLSDSASAWDGSDWIAENPSGATAVSDHVHYTVEADVAVNNTTAVGVVFNATYANNKSFLMWQINVDSQTKGAVVLRPHRYNGSWATLANINLSELVEGLTVDSLKTTPLHLKIEVTNTFISTYVNGVCVEEARAFPSAGALEPCLGAIGAHSGTNEGGTIDNLRLTDLTASSEGRIVYDYNFDNGENPLSYNPLNANEVASVENGALRMFGSGVAVPPLANNLHYAVEADIMVEKSAVGILFNYQDNRNMFMWQINTATAGEVRLRPHQRINGVWNAPSPNPVVLNLPGVTNSSLKQTPIHLKINVTSSTITTYVNNTVVDTRATSSMGLQPMLGAIGAHSGGGESGYIDNLKLTDYTEDSENGSVLYNYNFDDGTNPLSYDPQSNLEPPSIVDGRLYQSGNRWSLPATSRKSPFPSFRKTVKIDGEVEWARLYTTALGAFDMYIDGSRVGVKNGDNILYDELKPGYTDQAKTVHYYTYDVTDALQENATHLLSAQLAKGWYGGLSGAVSSTLALRAKLLVKYAGQSDPVVIGTDGSWKTAYPSGFIFAAIYDGETFDGNMDNRWQSDPNYDDSAWGQATVLNGWNGKIKPVSGSRVQLRDDLTRDAYAVTVYDGTTGADNDQYGVINVVGRYTQDDTFTLRAGETAVIDFGQNFAGWPEITASGAKETVITMRTGEMLNDANGLISRGNDGPEGSVHHANYRTAASTGRYIMNGNGEETYHSTYTFYGFRYIDITATADITIQKMRGLVLTSMLEDTGFVETSDPDVNQLISNIKWGGYSNILSIPTDCPQRNERSGWTADTQVFSTTGMYCADLQNFYRKWMDDMRDAARASDGAFRTIAPTNPTEGYEAGWSDAGVIVPYNVYKMTGDIRILEENWDAMQKFMDVYMASTNKEGGGIRYGDWVSLENNDEAVKRLCAIAYYAGDALMMAEMAEALGKEEDAARYREVYTIEKAYFQEKYVNADGSLKRTEQTCCLMALGYDLLPNTASREKVKNALLENLASHGNKLQTGFLGTAMIMQTLTKIGAADMAYNLLLQHEFPSWLYCVDLGATTTWERWNSYTLEDGFSYKRLEGVYDPANMNSFNHYAYGAVGEWIYSYMAGIMYDVNQPGFKHTILQPTLDLSGRITSANAVYRSPYGEISSSWSLDSDLRISYEAAVPANTTATLRLPLKNAEDQILLNGAPFVSDGTAKLTGYADGCAVIELGSGSYRFRVLDKNAALPVEDISGLPEMILAGREVTLSGIVLPAEAGKTEISWTIADAGTTGAKLSENRLTAAAPGVLELTASVADGLSPGEAFTKTFRITVLLPGDLNRDGQVTVSDVVALRQLIVRGDADAAEQLTGNLDDSDDSLTVADVVALRKRIVAG